MKRFAAFESITVTIALVAALIVALPIVSIAVIALAPAPDVWDHLLTYVLPRALLDTGALLLGVGSVALVCGAGPAWIISAHDFPMRSQLLWLMPLPLAIPTYIAAYVYADLFDPLGPAQDFLTIWLSAQDAVRLLPAVRSLPGAIFVIGFVLYPYVYLAARAGFSNRSADVAEVARTLGARRWHTFRRLTLPMLRPSLAVGLALVLLETLNDIGASEYLGVPTLTVSIFTTWLNRGSLPGAAQIACLLLLIASILLALERYGRRNVSVAQSAENPRLLVRRPLEGWRAWLAVTACGVPLLLGFVLPLTSLIASIIRRGLWTQADAAFARSIAFSVTYAALATAATLLLALAIALAGRWRPGRRATLTAGIAHSGYAMPGLVLALGLLGPLAAFDNALGAVLRDVGVATPGLVLIGSGGAIVIAYVVRFLAVPLGFAQTGLARVPRDYDDSALVVGSGRLALAQRIHVPLIRPALWGAAIVVFVDGLKELPATLLLRPLNVETLSTSIYQFAARGSFEDGSLAALLIVAVSVAPVIWLTRVSDLPEGPV